MLFLIDRSEKENREYGLLLCEKKKNKEIIHSNICIGSNCALSLESAKCAANTKEIAAFHTHPTGEIPSITRTRPSEGDIVATAFYGRKSLCIGYRNDMSINNIDCYDINDKSILELGEKAYELQNRGEMTGAFETSKKIHHRLHELKYPERKEVLGNKCSLLKSN